MTIASSNVASLAGAATPHNGFSLISNDKLIEIYSTMLKCRMLQARVRAALTGATRNDALREEAAIAGAALDLQAGDTLAPSHNGFAAAFVKGMPLDAVLSMARPNGTKRRVQYARLNLIPPALSLAAQLERAVDAAAANKKARKKQVVVAFYGKADDAAGALQDAMRQAGKRKLPMLLVGHSDWESDEICARAKECEIPGVVVDGDDAVAVYRVATEAIAHARRGSGPTLIDCKPWAVAGAKSAPRRATHDPIVRMEEYLTRKGLFDRKIKLKVGAEFRRELAAAIGDTGLKKI